MRPAGCFVEHEGTLAIMNHLAGMQNRRPIAGGGGRVQELLTAYARLRTGERRSAAHDVDLGGVLAKEGKVDQAKAVFEELSTVQRRMPRPHAPGNVGSEPGVDRPPQRANGPHLPRREAGCLRKRRTR